MKNVVYRGKKVDDGKWVYFNQNGVYCDENGNQIQPKRIIRDCGYKVIGETIEKLTV